MERDGFVKVVTALTLERMVTFAVTGMIGPLVPAIARTFHVTLGLPPLFTAITALGWGTAALGTPRLLRQYPARTVLATGLVVMGIGTLLGGQASSFLAMLAWRCLVGLGGGLMGPASNAYLVEAVSPRRRGIAFGWVTTGLALGGAVFVPLLVAGAARAGWRWAFAAEGGALVLVAGLLVALLRLQQYHPYPKRDECGTAAPRTAQRTLRGVLVANVCERSVNGFMVTFWPALLEVRYHWTLAQVAPLLGMFYATAAVGAVLGGYAFRGTETRRMRQTYRAGLGVGSALAAILLAVAVPVWMFLAAGMLYALLDNVVRPLYFRLIATDNPTYRDTLSWNAVGNQSATVVATALPALLIPAYGVAVVGILAGVWGGAGVLMVSDPVRGLRRPSRGTHSLQG